MGVHVSVSQDIILMVVFVYFVLMVNNGIHSKINVNAPSIMCGMVISARKVYNAQGIGSIMKLLINAYARMVNSGTATCV